MHHNNIRNIRKYLRENDPATTSDIARAIGARREYVHDALNNMVDAYIVDWGYSKGVTKYKQLCAIWTVIIPPANAPKPAPAIKRTYQRSRANNLLVKTVEQAQAAPAPSNDRPKTKWRLPV